MYTALLVRGLGFYKLECWDHDDVVLNLLAKQTGYDL